MKKRKLKKSVKKLLYILASIIIFIILIIMGINYLKYRNSYEYKLESIGYNEEQIKIIKTLENKYIDDVLTKEYNKTIPSFIKQKYFIYDNLNEYLEYYKENNNRKLSDVISLVNVKANYDHYDEDIIKETDTSKGILMLVNKYNYLNEDYSPNDIVDISNYYAYANNEIKEEVYKQYKKMWNDAKKEDLTLIVTSSYRDYALQDRLWTSRADNYGEEEADSNTARAGHSEHQSGLALDIVTYNTIMNDFEKTDEFKWLQKNAYKYGFILRYPSDKEEITGYVYESWHYRYVGVDTARKIKDLDITFDEYYAYYIEAGLK